jgi:2-polyprenyl-6-hydroxyphenyl methylase/3-demethylubiquinone-9 3-methyltransferase
MPLPNALRPALAPVYNNRLPMNPPVTRRSTVWRGARSLLGRLRHARQRAAAPGIDDWNSEFESGTWDYLAELPELARYSVLVGYAMHFNPAGAILDIGCGAGVFYRRVRPYGVARYVGIDISSCAIGKLRELDDHRCTFVVADAQRYLPTEQFDTIVFNEVLYYFRDPLATVQRYAGALKSGGILLLSTCTQFKGGSAILKRLKARYALLDETRVIHGAAKRSWIVSALAGDRGAPAAGPDT